MLNRQCDSKEVHSEHVWRPYGKGKHRMGDRWCKGRTRAERRCTNTKTPMGRRPKEEDQ